MEIYSSACVACWGKAPIAYVLGIFAYMIGGQNFQAGIAIIALITIDLVTAIMAAYRAGDPIESRKALKSFTKVTVYGLFLSAVHLAEVVVPGTTFFDEAALAFLALTEAISVMENVGRMGYPVPLKLLNRLRDIKNEK